ncbi:MAG TPA: enoyl-CoA hydratase-related protein [Syntrophomonadaceae bacterium]|nr:enoyl-CoA hydratase-related protein [Syntrophomonadaceae bacterium]
MSNDAVLWCKQDGICTITLNLPQTMNALNGDMIQGMVRAFQACFDENVRAVVLTGAGKAFCLGGDIAFASKYDDGDLQAFFRDFTIPLARLISDMRQLPKPIIASINGICAGVGMSFAAACDLRICHEEVVFKQAYTGVGISQDGGFSQLVPLIIGLGRASEMVFLDEVITAAKALEWGFVNKVVAPEELAVETMTMATKLANGATKAFASSKALLNKSMLPLLEVQLEAERIGVINTSGSDDYKEGIAVFTGNKKKPEFKGI